MCSNMFQIIMNRSLLHGVKLSSAIAALSITQRATAHNQSHGLSMSAGQNTNTFDFIVIGAGSGGMACARRAATYGKKV